MLVETETVGVFVMLGKAVGLVLLVVDSSESPEFVTSQIYLKDVDDLDLRGKDYSNASLGPFHS
jgi:hypothetical protein